MEAATAPAEPQHVVALRRANAVRMGHSKLKRDIAAGKLTAAQAFADPRATGSLTVSALLRAQPHWGNNRARKFCRALAIRENRPVVELTERQRKMIAAELAR